MMGHHRVLGGRSAIAALLLTWFAVAGSSETSATPINATLGIDSGALAGTDSAGRVLLYTPNPLEPGSSVSHFDSSAFPDLLMEPSNSSGLAFQQLDLTIFQLRDEGWTPGTSTITLRFQDPAGQGFNDPTLGAQRRTAMQRVAAVFAARLRSTVEINVDVDFQSLNCGNGSGVLAQAGAQFLYESFAGAPVPGTWYHGALAEALSGQNLSLEDSPNPDAGDLALTFNSQIDNGCLNAGSRYYYGLDGNVPAGQVSFVNVALHEMAHGLGFSAFADGSTGALFLGQPDIYTRFMFDNTQGRSWNQMTNAQRRTSAVNSRQVAWNGSLVTQQARNFLTPGPTLRINSPASIAGTYQVATANFGPPLNSTGVTGELVLAVTNSGAPSELCGAVSNPGEVAGNIAVVDRGNCNFTVKVRNAQNAGAIGVVIINNVAGDPPGLGGTDASITIPSVGITQADGQLIRTTLQEVSQPGSLAFSASTFAVDEAAGTANVTVRRSGGTDGTVSVDVATGGGTATDGEDFTASAGSVTFGDGQGGTRNFQVPILDDLVTEGEETVDLALSNVTGGATLGDPATAVLQIADDDVNPAGFLAFTASSFQTNEGAGNVVVSVERQGGTVGAVTADFTTGGGTATAGDDYVVSMGTIGFADGEGGTQTFEVELVDDEVEESIETIGLALSNPSGGALLGTPSSSLIQIVDNEACQESESRLCLEQGRFRVEVTWRDFEDATGPGTVEPLASDSSGLFWFFTRNNLEMLVKVLDGCGVNERFWVFAAATTNVEYTLQVTDTLTGEVQEYSNPLGTASPAITDTNAFATCDVNGLGTGDSTLTTATAALAESQLTVTESIDAPSECVAGDNVLCLEEGRFQVEISWRDFEGATGPGTVEPLVSDDSGLFWFFDRNNLEALVKVLDGCGVNERFWVFAAATTDVEYTLKVTDTDNGQVREYRNPLGVASPAVTDTDAFATCP